MKPLILALGWLTFGALAVTGLCCFVMALKPDPDSTVVPVDFQRSNVTVLDDWKGAS